MASGSGVTFSFNPVKAGLSNIDVVVLPQDDRTVGYILSLSLDDLLDMEWNHAEKNGGMTFMGKTIKGVTRAIMSIQNAAMYGTKQAKD